MQLRQRPIDQTPILRVLPPSLPREDADDLTPLTFAVAAGVVLLGLVIRLGFVLSADFPLHDGGLFFQMVRDLQRAHYALPATTTYNNGGIPFAYPPLSLYVAGFLDDLTPLGLINIFRFLPLMASTATIGAFLLLARAAMPSRTSALAATFAFAMVPRSFEWMIMGGGLTRSFGFLFAILTVHSAYMLYARRRRRYAISAAVFASLALASHIEMAWFAAFSAVMLFVAYGRSWQSLRWSCAVALATFALTAPWWIDVVIQHGISPFMAAAPTGSQSNPLLHLIVFRPTDEPIFALIASLAVLGSIRCLARREYLLPAWLVLCAILDSRGWGTVGSLPIALLSGIALVEVIVPLAGGALSRSGRASEPGHRSSPVWLVPTLVSVTVLYAVLAALISAPRLLRAMSPDERAGLAWVASNTPPGSQVLVVTNDRWYTDRTSEWFPVLADRQSVATVQGYEWTASGDFNARRARFDAVQDCATRDGDCLADWSRDSATRFDYVYIPKLAPVSTGSGGEPSECCGALRAALRVDPRYAVAFDGPGATIFKVKT